MPRAFFVDHVLIPPHVMKLIQMYKNNNIQGEMKVKRIQTRFSFLSS